MYVFMYINTDRYVCIYVYIYITESLCYTPETNTIL